jgi:Phosphatidylinositol N-acetylglucosaminyltransferase subunit Y
MAETRPLPAEEKPIPFPSIVSDTGMIKGGQPQATEKAHVDRSALAHRRTISGNILSKLSLLRTSSSSDKSSSLERISDREDNPPLSGSLALVQQNGKTRKRKGSLRKTALLGKGVLGRDRKGSDVKLKSPLSSPQSPKESENAVTTTTQESDTDVTPRPSQDDDSPVLAISPPKWAFPTSKISLSSIRSSVPSVEPASSRASITSPTLPTDHSTTDDDDQLLSFPKLPFISARKPPSSSGDSYFPPQQPFRPRRPTNRTKSPLATQPQSLTSSPVASEEEWDYSETAYWGYVILVITWLVFVVGMGSCFDVWSWAWDVGETPAAPPELNDDPTLPIVGYYPALMVLTSVMAWVWVVVAWVGMKYFRHAEGRGDDG